MTHHHKNSSFKAMLWIIVPCLVLAAVLSIGGSRLPPLASDGYFWPVLLVVFVLAHVFGVCKLFGSFHGSKNKINRSYEQ